MIHGDLKSCWWEGTVKSGWRCRVNGRGRRCEDGFEVVSERIRSRGLLREEAVVRVEA